MSKTTFRLHPAQQDVFIDQLINVNSPQYNIGGYIVLKGPLNKELLKQTISNAPAIFDAFRMRFDMNAPDLVGYLDDSFETFQLGETDLSGKPHATEYAKAWMQERMNTVFQLKQDSCLFEQVLLKISDNEHWLFGRFHHLVMDGFGFIVWVKYMASKYKSLVEGEPFTNEYFSYLSEASAANSAINTASTMQDDTYWKEKIPSRPGPLLKKKYEIVESSETKAGSISINLTAQQRQQLDQLAHELKASLQQITIAALLIYFKKITSENRFLLGIPVHKRNSRKLRNIVGLFNSFLPFTGELEPSTNVSALIKAVASTQSRDYRHQDFNIGNLSRHLQVNPAVDNLWDLIVNYLPLNFELNFGSQIEASIYRLVNEFERLPLQVCWNDYGKQQPLELQIHFSKEYFENDEALLLGNRILYILQQFCLNPEKIAIDIAIIPDEELKLISAFAKHEQKLPLSVRRSGNAEVLILDNQGNLLPVGVEGELHYKDENAKIVTTGIFAYWSANGDLKTTDGLPLTTSPQPGLVITISSTFVADPLEDYIIYWSKEFDLELQVKLAPYNQVFQQLLNSSSDFNTGNGMNILLIRIEDWIRDQLDSSPEVQIQLIRETSQQLLAAFDESRRYTSKPSLVGLIPWILNDNLEPQVATEIAKQHEIIEKFLLSASLYYKFDFHETITLYNVEEIFDKKSDELGHIPFTDELYAALGTNISRKIRAWKQPAYKVIALDCDNTLWKGICGEVGAMNVEIDANAAELQEFLIKKYQEGFLLVLCSKNNEEDVWEVFDHHPAMKLRRDHIAAYKVNWDPKPSNLRTIADQLNLNSDSFIFLDDNDFEVEHMAMACPEVLSITIPGPEDKMLDFLNHIWAFDIFQVTEEDRQRNSMYNAEKQRKEEQVKYSTIQDFILTLEVRVNKRKLVLNDLERAVQLSLRTNQFNLNGIRKSHEEISALISENKGLNLVVDVQDKFGDYGTVGLLLANVDGNELWINSFLLSCRVLGRNVEENILQELIEYCKMNGLKSIKALFKSTGKNKPIIDFLHRTNWIADPLTEAYHFIVDQKAAELSHTHNEKQAIQ